MSANNGEDATVSGVDWDDQIPAFADAHPLPPLPNRTPVALPAGFRVQEYRIDGVIGRDAFSVSYKAFDQNLSVPVTLKEYMPQALAFRAASGNVMASATRHVKSFIEGLNKFLSEGRTLATFHHPSIVHVMRLIETHGTAYMVLEYEESRPLTAWWPEQQSMGESGLVAHLQPLLDGLAAVHATGFLHRDIKPENIQVRAKDGRLMLTGFGSAGKVVEADGQTGVAVTPGYSPIEQYTRRAQGPWTDLYALAATLYWAISGSTPAEARLRRSDPRVLVPAEEAGRGRFGTAFLGALDRALQLDAAQRPRTVDEFRRELFADHSSTVILQDVLTRRNELGETSPWPRFLSPRDWPLPLKMTLAMVATALLPMLITAGYNMHGTKEAVTAAELRYVEQMAHSAAGRVGQLITDSRHFARALGTDHDFAAFLAHPDNAGKGAIRAKLERLTAANPDVHLIMLMDAAGVAVVSSDPAVMGRNFAFRQYFKEAIAGRSFASGLVVGAVAGAAGMFYSEPVRQGETVIGAIVLRIKASSFATILSEVRHDPTLTPFLVDADGVMISHPREELLYRSLVPLTQEKLAAIRADQRFRRDNIDSLNMPELAKAMVGTRATGHVSYHSSITKQAEIAGIAPVPGHDWVVGVTESRTEFEEPLKRLYVPLLWSVLLIGMLFTGLALAFARTIVRPVRDLTDAVRALEQGDFDRATLPPGTRDELGQLTRTFNVMINVLRRRDQHRP